MHHMVISTQPRPYNGTPYNGNTPYNGTPYHGMSPVNGMTPVHGLSRCGSEERFPVQEIMPMSIQGGPQYYALPPAAQGGHPHTLTPTYNNEYAHESGQQTPVYYTQQMPGKYTTYHNTLHHNTTQHNATQHNTTQITSFHYPSPPHLPPPNPHLLPHPLHPLLTPTFLPSSPSIPSPSTPS